jgi:sugar phosphate permease
VSEVTSRGARPVRYAIWGTTWLSYLTYYFGRKGLPVAKTSIGEAHGAEALVGVDTGYLAAYALGQYVHGYLGDRVGARVLVTVGMLASAACCLWFGLGGAAIVFLLAFTANGFFQATGWPGNVKAMAEWTTPQNRGAVMGVWASCYQVGGIVATVFATWMLGRVGWRGAFWGPALVLIGVAALVFFVVRAPNTGQVRATSLTELVEERRRAQRALLASPKIYAFGLSYFFIKLMRYSLLFWLPTYLEKGLAYDKTTAGYLSTSFEVGGVVGTILLGLLSDRVRKLSRAGWAASSLMLLPLALALYAKIGGLGFTANFVAMALIGVLLFGPDAILSGAAAQDAGGPKAAAAAAGLVNGIGSLGAILQEFVTKGVASRWGWEVLFDVFIAFSVFAALMLLPVVRRPDASTS